jgi:hypothetical protein
MSRNNRRSTSPKGANLPGSHPQENLPDHRAFLIRSLERNDTDMSALIELNRSLHKAKQDIIESCGELVLLDLGQGRLKLVNDELHQSQDSDEQQELQLQQQQQQQHHLLSPYQKELCVDFLLRIKLRRKLSNRFARRLNRLAHALDGEDISPPPPPKYGDLRLHIDPQSVKAYADHWKRQDEARKKIEGAKQEREKLVEDAAAAAIAKPPQEQPELAASEKVATDTVAADTDTDAVAAAVADTDTVDAVAADKGSNDKTPPQDEQEPTQHMAEARTGTDEAQPPPPAEVPQSEPRSQPQEEPTAATAAAETLPDPPPEAVESTTTASSTSSSTPTPSLVDATTILRAPAPWEETKSLVREFDILKDYNNAYEKRWDPDTNKFQYTITETDEQEDHNAIKFGAGIGATHRSMSARDREMEHRRWQTALLGRIPEQPTFEELGLANRVFYLEARRKLCLEKEQETPTKTEEEDEDAEKQGEKKTTKAKKKLKMESDAEEEESEEEDSSDADEDNAKKENKDEEQDPVGEATKKGGDKEEKKKAKGKDKTKDDDDDDDDESSDMFEDDDEKKKEDDESSDMFDDDDDEKKNTETGGKSVRVDADDDDNEKEADTDGQEETEEEPLKRIRPMSLAAVPSFYEQDLKRIKLVHGDLMAASMHEHARHRLAGVTSDYNKGKPFSCFCLSTAFVSFHKTLTCQFCPLLSCSIPHIQRTLRPSPKTPTAALRLCVSEPGQEGQAQERLCA